MTGKRQKLLREAGGYLLFLAPAVILFLALEIVPLLLNIGYSLTNWDGISSKFSFVGLSNYVKLFTDDPRFWTSMVFTIKNSLVVVVFTNLLGLAFALGLSHRIPLRNFMRASFYIPKVVGGVILGFVWQFIFSNIFPAIGQMTGWHVFQLQWLGTPETSFWAMAIVQVWSSAGYMMIIYVAGLSAISNDYIEAAVLDGANSMQVLLHVKLPLIMPAITECLFLSLLNAMKVYDLNISLTGGGPYRTSEAITMNVFQTAFTESQMGYGAAKAFIMAVVVVAMTLLQVAITSKREVQV